jgi:hypothetical protein
MFPVSNFDKINVDDATIEMFLGFWHLFHYSRLISIQLWWVKISIESLSHAAWFENSSIVCKIRSLNFRVKSAEAINYEAIRSELKSDEVDQIIDW